MSKIKGPRPNIISIDISILGQRILVPDTTAAETTSLFSTKMDVVSAAVVSGIDIRTNYLKRVP